MSQSNPHGKVGLVGTGMVGCSFAYALVQEGIASSLVLVDLDRERAEGEAMDLNHGLPFVRPMTIAAGDYAALAGSDVVVVTAGRNQKPGESRLDLVRSNIAVMEDVIPQLVQANPGGVILIATNPVDILTEVSAEIAGLPPGRVLGTGTVLDTARFRFLLGEFLGVNPRSVHAYIAGEHGDSQVPIWSQANVAGLDLEHIAAPDGRRIGHAERLELAEKTRNAAYEIIKRKHATYYAIGLGILAVVEAILRDQKTALSVCAPVHGLYGLERVALSFPTIVGRTGAERLLEVPLSADEVKAFVASANTLRKVLDDARTTNGGE